MITHLLMTEKQIQILTHALKLFADHGFHGTSTSRIAKAAKVSEGLIFRHFGNKEGLLQAIIEFGHEKAQQLFLHIDESQSLQNQLRELLSIPFQLPKEDYAFWKLLYSLKWQAESYDDNMSAPFKEMITNLLTQLNYKDPEIEADIIMMIFNGAATAILLKGLDNQEKILEALLKKYNL